MEAEILDVFVREVGFCAARKICAICGLVFGHSVRPLSKIDFRLSTFYSLMRGPDTEKGSLKAPSLCLGPACAVCFFPCIACASRELKSAHEITSQALQGTRGRTVFNCAHLVVQVACQESSAISVRPAFAMCEFLICAFLPPGRVSCPLLGDSETGWRSNFFIGRDAGRFSQRQVDRGRLTRLGYMAQSTQEDGADSTEPGSSLKTRRPQFLAFVSPVC
jgi:hypothetical protein